MDNYFKTINPQPAELWHKPQHDTPSCLSAEQTQTVLLPFVFCNTKSTNCDRAPRLGERIIEIYEVSST